MSLASKTVHFIWSQVSCAEEVVGHFSRRPAASNGTFVLTDPYLNWACCHPHVIEMTGASDVVYAIFCIAVRMCPLLPGEVAQL